MVRSLQVRLLGGIRLGLERRRAALDRLVFNRAFNVAPNKLRELEQRFDEATLRLAQAMSRRTRDCEHRSSAAAARLARVDLGRLLQRKQEALGRGEQRLRAAFRSLAAAKRGSLDLAAGRLNAMSPLAILERGYSICRDARGNLVREAASTVPGDRIEARLARGVLECRVESIKP